MQSSGISFQIELAVKSATFCQILAFILRKTNERLLQSTISHSKVKRPENNGLVILKSTNMVYGGFSLEVWNLFEKVYVMCVKNARVLLLPVS